MINKKNITAAFILSAFILQGSLTASAEVNVSDVKSVEEKAFISSFDNEEEVQIAEYLIDNGLSLDEAEKTMNIYESSSASTTDSTTFSYPYYSLTDIADSNHYMAVIVKNPSKAINHLFDIYYKSASMRYTGVERVGKLYADYEENLESEFNITLTSSDIADASSYKGITTPVNVGATSQTTPALLKAFGFEKKGRIYSENEFRNLFATNEYYLNGSKKIGQSDLAFETLAVGDVDHDGVLTSDDSAWILKKLVLSTDLEFTFSDGSTHYTKATAELAADYNEDGTVDIGDVVSLNNYLS